MQFANVTDLLNRLPNFTYWEQLKAAMNLVFGEIMPGGTYYAETLTAAGPISLTARVTSLALTGAGAVTLAAPDAQAHGRMKIVEMTANNGNVTLALTNVEGGTASTTATFSAVGHTLILVARSAKWVVIKQQGVALT